MESVVYLIPIFGIIALVFALLKSSWVNKQDMGTDRMKEICGYVKDGAMAFLGREYKVLAIFVVCVAILLAIANMTSAEGTYRNPLIALSFVVGAFCIWILVFAVFFGFVCCFTYFVQATCKMGEN